MKLPRDLSGKQLAKLLERFGYAPTRQTGSHLRLTTSQGGQHHITVPLHRSIPVGTLRGILHEVSGHFEIPSDQVSARLFDQP